MRGREEGDRAADGVRGASGHSIHEVADAPNRVVGAFLPDDIFTGGGDR
jgi:hypothetical protein